MEFASTIQPSVKENRVHSTRTDLDGFSPAVFRSRLEQKIPVTECLVCCVCVLFSMAKSVLRVGHCVRFCFAIAFYSFALCAAKVPLGQCFKVSLL